MARLSVAARQRGAALLIAMIIVALVATLATAMVWQQWRAVQVEAAERARAQSGWMLNAAVDWARLFLREDTKVDSDDLGEPWATPLAEARLSTFLAADKDNTDDGPEAFLSGAITDAQSRYNLFNMAGKKDLLLAEEAGTLARLFSGIGVAPDLADIIAANLNRALATDASAQGALLMPQSVSQLGWLGVDDASIALMAPYVTILPETTTINVNTAPREVIASIKGLDAASAQQLVLARQRAPFTSDLDIKKVLPAYTSASGVGFTSKFFQVRGRLRLGDRVLEETSLVRRDAAPRGKVTTIYHRRESAHDAGN